MTTMNGAGDDNNSNNERNNQQQQQPQIDDAKNFLERVKEAFKNEKGVYDRFVEIMKNFKHDRLNTGGVIKEVQELFSGHNELFIGFQNFLPAAGLLSQDELRQTMQSMNESGPNMRGNGHNNSISMTPMGPNQDPSSTAPPDFNMAVTFICKIKQRFGSHRRIYQEFLQILQHFQTAAQANDTSVIKDVKIRIRALFRDHPDLLDQFDYFLPPLTAHFSKGNTTVSAQSSIGDNTDRVNGRSSRKRRAESDLDNQPDSKRRRHDHETETNAETRKRRGRKARDEHKRNKSLRRKKDRDNRGKSDDDDDDDEITFSDGDIDHDSDNNNNNRDKEDGMKVETTTTAVAVTESTNSTSNNNNTKTGSSEQQQHGEHQGLRIFSKLRRDIPDHLYKHILTLTQLYPMGLTEFSVVGKLICDALREHGHNDLMREFQSELQSSEQSWFFRSRGQNYYEYLTNNMLLKSCKAVQSSYRELPQDVVQPRCSGRHPDAAAHLNDYYVSKPTGGEGGSTTTTAATTSNATGTSSSNNNNNTGADTNNNNHNSNANASRLKSIYNDNLQKSEDDLFELDMMIETNDAARKRLEQLYKSVMAPANVNNSIICNLRTKGEILIPPVEKRAISRLYSEHGNKVLNLLKKMPETTIPVVLKRLREKSNEWMQLKNEMKIVWKSVATKNYFKAHDYRYTIFKQYDTKRISFKNICKQIEERHLKQKRMRLFHNNKNKEEERYDNDDPDIAINKSNIMAAGNGVVSGVGLIGNASHDHIIQQMGAGLHVELGLNNEKYCDYDYTFNMENGEVLVDCARFIFQYANTAEVGKESKEKKLFAEITQNIYFDFFKIDISAQCEAFLSTNIESTSSSSSPPSVDGCASASVSNSNSELELDRISKIMRGMECFSQIAIDNVSMDDNVDNMDVAMDDDEEHVTIYGNRVIYALFRYLHLLYARMSYALKLCKLRNPLYGRQSTKQEVCRKYQDFLSHLSKLINGQIEEEIFEDECRKLLGIRAYQLFTINRVIRYIYLQICEFDVDSKLHSFYKLFKLFQKEKLNKEIESKYFVMAHQCAMQNNSDLYQIQLCENESILTISLCDKYVPVTSANNNNNNNHHHHQHDIKMYDCNNNNNNQNQK